MTRKTKSAAVGADNPEWTARDAARALRLTELPARLQTKLRGIRGPQKAPTKVPVSIRLSAEVVGAFRATGPGWQGRMDALLRDAVKRGRVRVP